MHARLLETMPVGVSLSDESGIILYTNPTLDETFGYNPEELIGKNLKVLNNYSPEENTALVNGIIQRLQSHGIWAGEILSRKKKGATFTRAARIRGMDMSGKLYWVSVQADVTGPEQA